SFSSRSREKGEAFADRNRAAAKGGEIRIYTDLEELAEDADIRAVYIASPNSLHVSQSKRMLEAGKHVICEKPIAIYPEQLKELQKLAREKDLVYMEAIMMLHQPQLRALKEGIGRIGRMRCAHVDFSQLSSKYGAYVQGKNPNIFNPAFCTGALEDLGIYCFYMVLELFGAPKSFQITPMFLDTGADCSGEVILDYGDTHVTVTYCKVGQSRLGSQFMGDKGTLTMELVSQMTGMYLYDKEGNRELLWGQEEKDHLMGNEAKDLALFIENPEAPREETQGGVTYSECSQKAMDVCVFLEELRREAGIRFPEDPHAL
ncbi:MAG: Gfo/Idh/MocA family oxidoreductase, partial [Lachnospiraceae bacterium]|nr:Gfo/Idh/MocA family oxidoreductase [Lachnospiraceae bacterium]